MRKNLLLLLGLLSFLVVSCEFDDEDPVYYSYTLGVVKGNTVSEFMIHTDSKHLLKPVAYPNNYTIKDGTRVFIQYVVEKEIKDEQVAYDYEVKIAAIDNILTKDIKIADDVLRDTIGNDPVSISYLSTANDFLTVEFSFFGDSKTHYFDLVYDDKNQKKEGFITLDFHHDVNGDYQTRNYGGIISFPISHLQVDGQEIVKILFTSKKMDGTPFEKELEYKYSSEEDDVIEE